MSLSLSSSSCLFGLGSVLVDVQFFCVSPLDTLVRLVVVLVCVSFSVSVWKWYVFQSFLIARGPVVSVELGPVVCLFLSNGCFFVARALGRLVGSMHSIPAIVLRIRFTSFRAFC